MTGLRAADNAGFTNFGVAMCMICCAAFFVICITNYKAKIIVISILMCIHSFAAIMTCEKWHSTDYIHSNTMKEVFGKYQDTPTEILCIDDSCYMDVLSMKLYYQTGNRLNNVSIAPIANTELRYFDESELGYLIALESDLVDKDTYEENRDLYEGKLEQGPIFLKWDRRRFREVPVSTEIHMLEDNQIQILCKADNIPLLVCGKYILPTNMVDDNIVTTFDRDKLTEDIIYVYNVMNLTVEKIILE